ncbi:MAG: hypothetical protein IJ936_06170 [Peptococcaceae bacterium]|nr:hypothetical protein [Peptococcaceae bacterium]
MSRSKQFENKNLAHNNAATKKSLDRVSKSNQSTVSGGNEYYFTALPDGGMAIWNTKNRFDCFVRACDIACVPGCSVYFTPNPETNTDRCIAVPKASVDTVLQFCDDAGIVLHPSEIFAGGRDIWRSYKWF